MENYKLDDLINNLIALGPLFKKKLISKYHPSLEGLTPAHFNVLLIVQKIGPCPISDIANKLMISTPNMSKLLNKLIEEDLLIKVNDKTDRRVINISLNENGINYLDKECKSFEKKIKQKLLILDNDDLEKLILSTNMLTEVLSNID
ncbi:MAG: MarR family winged helix-turn-helix transcriptional regulator [Peptostreptococcaceae bacterium]